MNSLINWRRNFHQYAETGWTEFRTTAVIASLLEQWGYEVLVGLDVIDPLAVMGRPCEETIEKQKRRAVQQGADPKWIDRMNGYTGVMGILKTNRAGNITALRFDMDANDITETSDVHHMPYQQGFASINNGAMHACGHDGHIAIGLGVAEHLSQIQSELAGEIRLIFQPAEEGVRGAKAMVSKGIVDDVDYFLAGHIGFGLPQGTFCAKTAGFLATSKYDVRFVGIAAHAGANPEKGRNALLAAAKSMVEIHEMPKRPEGITRANVGVLNGGTGRNIVADYAEMMLETRGETTELNNWVENEVVKKIKNSADIYGVSVEILQSGGAGNAVSDPVLANQIKEVAAKITGIETILESHDLGGSEDATLFMERVQARGGKATYMIFGTEVVAGHHNNAFDFNEDVLTLGVKVFCSAVGLLNKL